MATSIFEEKAFVPGDDMVSMVLAENKSLWDNIKYHLAAAYKNVGEEWKFYGKASGWTLVIKSSKRTLAYLLPSSGFFKVNLVFGEKAVAAAQATALPAPILQSILDAKPHMEGRSFMVDVKTAEDAGLVKRLIGIKGEN